MTQPTVLVTTLIMGPRALPSIMIIGAMAPPSMITMINRCDGFTLEK